MLPDTMQLSESLTAARVSSTTMQFRAGESVVITVAGNAVPLLIPALLQELARPRPWAEVVTSLERIATREVITECAEILFEKGILVAAPGSTDRLRKEEHAVYRFFANPPYAPDEMLEKIRNSTLGTLCEDGLEEQLVAKLRAHGFSQFASIDRDLSDGYTQFEGLDLLIVLIPHMEASTLDAINKGCLQAGTPWLPVDLFSGAFCALGPLITPGTGGCYECYRSRIRSNLQSAADAYDDFINFQRSTRTSVSNFGMLPAGIEIAFGLVCLEVLKLVTQFQVPACIGHNLVVNLAELELQRHRVLQIPRCPACSQADAAPQGHWTV
jgi:bacteriocin biosynthesis cyclodehydratase domain-containing protein